MNKDKPFVSVVIPCYREMRHIDICLASLERQTYGKENYEIIVVDGMSADGTREVIKKYSDSGFNVILTDNPKQITPVAMNLGIQKAKGDYILRLDAHVEVPLDYIERCMETMKRVNAEVVGGPMQTKGDGFWGRMIAYVLTSIFGVGSSFRTLSDYNGYVDTLAFGLYKKDALLKAGLHDETLKRGQDWDIHHKIKKNGGRIYLDSTIRPVYYCADNPFKFLKKAFRDGYWIAAIFEKRSPRHLAPLFFVISIIGLAFLCYKRRYGHGPLEWVFFPLIAYLSLYYFVALLYSLGMVRRSGWKAIIIGPFLYAAFHLSRGIGSLSGILSGIWLRAGQDN